MYARKPEFINSYIETALWSSTAADGTPLDHDFSADDLAPEALEQIERDCAEFQARHAADIDEALDSHARIEKIAHDFWLTRNGHGAGFWDGDYETQLGERLTKASKAFGACDLYQGDDGLLYLA